MLAPDVMDGTECREAPPLGAGDLDGARAEFGDPVGVDWLGEWEGERNFLRARRFEPGMVDGRRAWRLKSKSENVARGDCFVGENKDVR
jgi:hypothetical protein